MAKQTKNVSSGGESFMVKLSTFIVDKRNLFFLITIILVIFSMFSRNWVEVENDLTFYLPEDSETKKALNAAGTQEALFAAYTAGERDYNALVSRMKGVGVEVIYVGGYYTEAGLILRQAKEQGMNVTLIGGDALVTNEFWQISGAAGEGTLMTFSSDPRRRPQAAEVVQRFRAKNIDPEGYVLYTYAAIQVWAQAADKLKNLEPRRIADALKSQGPWQTVLGEISFDRKGDVTAPDYVFYVWKNGAYSEI